MAYSNLDGGRIDKGFSELLRWKFGDGAYVPKRRPVAPTPWVSNDGAALQGAPRHALTWIGHASWLVQLGGRSLVVDPIWAEGLFIQKRATRPGLTLDALPVIDAVLVTHNHRDHLDAPSLRALAERARARGDAPPTFIVPLGVGAQLPRRLGPVVELGWWDHADVGDARVTLVPSEHWSQRGPFDRNETLWGGFVVEADGQRVYHSGDTAYFAGFRDIGARVGRIHAAMLPIGAYEPRWFMKPQHMNPDDAVQAFLDLGAERFVAMHWGTFKLTDEHLDEPPIRLREVLAARDLGADGFAIPAVGETIALR
ncbi:MAG: MBL fold metallo-hydrolase [Polyangiaceae bacterium]